MTEDEILTTKMRRWKDEKLQCINKYIIKMLQDEKKTKGWTRLKKTKWKWRDDEQMKRWYIPKYRP